jgi:signal peptidase
VVLLLVELLTFTGVLLVAVVPTNSMSPTINPGALVVFVRQDNYAVDDIIAFNVANVSIMHRIVEITPAGSFKTKGDNNPTEDPWIVPHVNVLGKLVFSIPEIGYPIFYLKEKGLPVILAILLALLATKIAYDYYKDRKKKKIGTAIMPKPETPLTPVAKEFPREVVAMAPCEHCGTLMPQTETFCPNCGTKRTS